MENATSETAVTVSQILDRYSVEDLPRLSPRTATDYRRHIETLRELWGGRDAETLKPREIGHFLRLGQPGAINRGKVAIVLRNAYKRAIGKWFIVEADPFRNLMLPKAGVRTRYVTDAEFAAVRAAAPDRLQIAMDLALLTGQRQGDLLAWRWDAIREDNVWIVEQGKTGAKLGIRITPALEAVLDRAWLLHPQGVRREYVLSNRYGLRYVSEGFRSMWNRHIKACRRSGLLKQPFTFHDLRAKCASDHANIDLAGNLLGHQDVKMTKRVYDRSIRVVDPLR